MNPLHHIKIEPIRALKDNYIWAIIDINQRNVVIVDPGEGAPVIDFLTKQSLSLAAILITHHHWDHVNGIEEILNNFSVPVFGPAKERIPYLSEFLTAAKKVKIAGFPLVFDVMEIPGHTSGHIAYYAPGMLFCGDTLFAAGCGRVFEGTHEQMFASLQKIAALPDDTKIYCAHEYTLNNLKFAQIVEPGNKDILERIQRVTEVRDRRQPSLPSILSEEKATNPFLRCDVPALKTTVEKHNYHYLNDTMAVFTALRKWKDDF